MDSLCLNKVFLQAHLVKSGWVAKIKPIVFFYLFFSQPLFIFSSVFALDFAKWQYGLKSEDPKMVMEVLREIETIGSGAAPLTSQLIAVLLKFKEKPANPVPNKILKALGNIGPKAKEALPIIESLAKEKGHAISALKALIKIGSGTQTLTTPKTSGTTPVFSFDFEKTPINQNFIQTVPKNIEYNSATNGISCSFPGNEIYKLNFPTPLLIGESFTISFWVTIKDLELKNGISIFSSDLLEVSLVRLGTFKVGVGKPELVGISNDLIFDMISANEERLAAFHRPLGKELTFLENNWNHVAFVRDGSQHLASIFFNGKKVYTDDDFMVWSGPSLQEPKPCLPKKEISKIEIGGDYHDEAFTSPKKVTIGFGHFNIFNYPLTDEEILREFNKGL